MIDEVNALSTVAIALATLVATKTTWNMANIEKNRENASNGVHVWVTPDHFFFMADGSDAITHRGLILNAQGSSSMPIFDAKVDLIADSAISGLVGISKGETVYTHIFPVLFDHEKNTGRHSIEIEKVRNKTLRNFLENPNNYENNKELCDDVATHLRVRLTFQDVHGNVWERNEKGKLKRKS
jgi:hypothetical protein